MYFLVILIFIQGINSNPFCQKIPKCTHNCSITRYVGVADTIQKICAGIDSTFICHNKSYIIHVCEYCVCNEKAALSKISPLSTSQENSTMIPENLTNSKINAIFTSQNISTMIPENPKNIVIFILVIMICTFLMFLITLICICRELKPINKSDLV